MGHVGQDVAVTYLFYRTTSQAVQSLFTHQRMPQGVRQELKRRNVSLKQVGDQVDTLLVLKRVQEDQLVWVVGVEKLIVVGMPSLIAWSAPGLLPLIDMRPILLNVWGSTALFGEWLLVQLLSKLA